MDRKNRVLIIICLLCFVVLAIVIYFMLTDGNDKKETISDKDRVVIATKEGLSFISDSFNVVSNKNCNSSSKRYNYSLSLEDGNVLVNNHDTFENFIIDNISNIKAIMSITYTNKCENSIYVLLSDNGRLYYSDDNISSFGNLRKLDEEFKMLNSRYFFNDLLIGNDNKLYSNTTTGEFVNINLQ